MKIVYVDRSEIFFRGLAVASQEDGGVKDAAAFEDEWVVAEESLGGGSGATGC